MEDLENRSAQIIQRAKHRLGRLFGGSTRSHEEANLRPTALREFLIALADNGDLALKHLPKQLDLGELGREAEWLMDASESDPQHREYGSVAYVDENRRVFVRREPVQGAERSIRVPIVGGARAMMMIHSHAYNFPFSAADLSGLVLAPHEHQALAAALLVTPTLKMLAVRTNQTPLLSKSEVAATLTHLWRPHYDSRGRAAQQQMATISEIVHRYNLQLFSGARSENVVRAAL